MIYELDGIKYQTLSILEAKMHPLLSKLDRASDMDSDYWWIFFDPTDIEISILLKIKYQCKSSTEDSEWFTVDCSRTTFFPSRNWKNSETGWFDPFFFRSRTVLDEERWLIPIE